MAQEKHKARETGGQQNKIPPEMLIPYQLLLHKFNKIFLNIYF